MHPETATQQIPKRTPVVRLPKIQTSTLPKTTPTQPARSQNENQGINRKDTTDQAQLQVRRSPRLAAKQNK